MGFNQFQFINNGEVQRKFNEICIKYPDCAGCPMLTQDIDIDGNMIRCETGRSKQTQTQTN